MSETAKTVTFVALAAVVAVVAFVSRPKPPATTSESMVGKELFADFTDPLAATSLEIFKYDEETAAVLPFKVAQVDGRWSIPSHDDYPADAKDHLAEVATGLMGLKVLEVASDSPGDHAIYGVVDPDPEKLTAGATGVGTRVTIKDKDDKTLLSLVIGKEVPDSDGLRYVRRTGQDPVYTVSLKTDKLSTKFADWIEKDLLKLSNWDIRDVEIVDYSIDLLQRDPLQMQNRLKLAYNDTGDPKWKLAEDDIVVNQATKEWVPNPKPMGENEELDAKKLDDMRSALDELQIVDVARKPEGLSEDLRNIADADKFLNNNEAMASLEERGFYPARFKGHMELFSTKGEIHCLTKDGVKYILRFGNIAGSGDSGDKQEGDGDSTKADSSGGVNRYLFVMTEFDPSVIEKPKLEPLPEKPASLKAKEAEKKDEKKADGDDKKADAKDASDAKADPPEEKSEEEKKYEAEVARIEKANKQKQDEYDEKVKKGKDKVKELSDRFADWYYVISDDTYSKIHLTRDGIVKEKEKKDEAKAGATSPAVPANPADMLHAPLGASAPAAAKEAPEAKPAEPETKPADEKPAPKAKPAEKKPADAAKPAEEKPADEAKSDKAEVSDAKPADEKPADAKAGEAKPAEKAKPAEAKPAEAKPAEKKPAEEAAK